jgi:hypothetical protein
LVSIDNTSFVINAYIIRSNIEKSNHFVDKTPAIALLLDIFQLLAYIDWKKEGFLMKLVILIGNSAVGKMTVGQELAKRTGLRLFHNHMMIEPVLEIFGQWRPDVTQRLRQVIFEEFAKSDSYGMIFTYMWAFDMQSDWDYHDWVRSIFEPYGTEFYYVELVADQQTRLQRNGTENRLRHKASKRDVEASNARLLRDNENHWLESLPGELPFENYVKIDNTHLAPEQVAAIIKERFAL